MRGWVVLLAVVLLIFVFALALYILFGTISALSFGGATIGSALTTLVLFRPIEVEAHEHLIVRRAGNYVDPGGPGGRFFLWRTLDVPVPVDMRPRNQTLESMKCFTRDGVEIDVSSFLLWRVVNPLHLLQNSPGRTNTPVALGQIVGETLMSAVGQLALQEVLQRRQDLARALRLTLQSLPQANIWGIEIVDVGLGEIKVPLEVAEAMARQVAAGLMVQARTAEGVGTAQALDQMQVVLNNPAAVDRALLLQVMRILSDAIAQRR
jgi:regulator of protease activity HflC (stomatin/prohibitin superfamily)